MNLRREAIFGFLAFVAFVGGILASLYFGLVYMLYGGICQAIEAFAAHPIVASDAAIGVMKCIFASLATGCAVTMTALTTLLLLVIGGFEAPGQS